MWTIAAGNRPAVEQDKATTVRESGKKGNRMCFRSVGGVMVSVLCIILGSLEVSARRQCCARIRLSVWCRAFH